MQPQLGRWFSEADTQPSAAGTVILAQAFWQGRWGGDASVIGRNLTIDGKPRVIVGVMPEDFRFLNAAAQVILPYQFDRSRLFIGDFSYQGIARLKPGATLAQANADVNRMLPLWMNAWPLLPGMDRKLLDSARFGAKLQPLKQDVVGNIGQVLWVLMGTIGAVLLIACANVANLLLVRAEGRQHELAIRACLGSGWRRIAGEMLAESTALGLMGGALGVGLAYGALRMLVAIAPATLPRLGEIGIDGAVLGFAFVISLFAGLLFGWIPALKYARPYVSVALRAGGRTQSHSRERHRARNVLVATQVALAVVLLVSSGLMIRTFQKLKSVDPGFTPSQVQMFRIVIPQAQVPNPEQVARMQQEILDRLKAIPGVMSASFGSGAPLEGFDFNDPLYAEDKDYALGQFPPMRRYRWVAPGYMGAVGTPMLAGRDFTWTDLYEYRKVALVSANLARELWGSADRALGRRVRRGPAEPWREVVGVVGDARDNGVHEQAPTMVYWPALMNEWGRGIRAQRAATFLLRSDRASTGSFLNEVHKAVWAVNGNLPVHFVRTLQRVYEGSMARTSFTLLMLAIAGGMALVLAIVGIYGVMSYAVSQRRREVGIRMALGARGGELKRMFAGHGLVVAGIGGAIGVGGAAGLTRFMKSLLFEISPLDPATYAGVVLALMIAAGLASYLPARRAAAVDPVEALRAE